MHIGYLLPKKAGISTTRPRTTKLLGEASKKLVKWDQNWASGLPATLPWRTCWMSFGTGLIFRIPLWRAWWLRVVLACGVSALPPVSLLENLYEMDSRGLSNCGLQRGWFSFITDRFDMTTSVRTAKKGLGFGLAFGLTQDLLFYLRGRPLWYVDMISGRRRLQELPAESTWNTRMYFHF